MKWGRAILVVFGALIITALGIDAADTLRGSQGTLLSQVIQTKEDVCPPGMNQVSSVPSLTCVDTYEVSTGPKCPNQNPNQIVGTQQNISTKECTAESKPNVKPWGFITRDQAMQMCARGGKRLPTSEEWYALSLGMGDTDRDCNVATEGVSETGTFASCISPSGAYDLVGNVWEWVSDDIMQGSHEGRPLPGSGYVAQVDGSGIATAVSDTPQDLFNHDYFWSRADGAYGMIRGGYYDSGNDAGVYAIHADTLPTSASIGIGFRCVR